MEKIKKTSIVGFFKSQFLADQHIEKREKNKLKGDKSKYFIEKKDNLFIVKCELNFSIDLQKTLDNIFN